jgi:hypothetical protein
MSQEILNPVGERQGGRKAAAVTRRKVRGKPVIGLLNNSKPNVAFFLETIEQELRAPGTNYEIINVVKPKSAGPCPDIELLAERCDYVINAVAD